MLDIVADCKVAEFTVKLALPETEPKLAVISVVPVASGVTTPKLLVLLSTVAIDVELELHVTKLVTSCLLLSVYIAVAWNWVITPTGILTLFGVTIIEEIVLLFWWLPPLEQSKIPHTINKTNINFIVKFCKLESVRVIIDILLKKL